MKKTATANGRGLSISEKSSTVVCGRISGMNLQKAKGLLMDVLAQKRSLDGKYYTKTSFHILRLLNSAESNAEFMGLDGGRLVVSASASEGFRYYRPRRFKMKRMLKKSTNVIVRLEER